MIFIQPKDGDERERDYFAFIPVRVNDRAVVWLERYIEIHMYDAKEKKWKPYKRGFKRNGSAFYLGSWENNINHYGRKTPCAPSLSLWRSLQQLLKDAVSNLLASRH